VRAGTAQDGSTDAANAAAPDGVPAPDPAREQAARVLATLQGALQGSASAPVPEAGSTLLLAVDAPAAEVRALVSSSWFCHRNILQSSLARGSAMQCELLWAIEWTMTTLNPHRFAYMQSSCWLHRRCTLQDHVRG